MGQIPIKLLGKKKDSKVNLKKDFGLDTTKLHFARFRHDLPHSGGRKNYAFLRRDKGDRFWNSIQYRVLTKPSNQPVYPGGCPVDIVLFAKSQLALYNRDSVRSHPSPMQCQVQSSVTEPRSPFI